MAQEKKDYEEGKAEETPSTGNGNGVHTTGPDEWSRAAKLIIGIVAAVLLGAMVFGLGWQ